MSCFVRASILARSLAGREAITWSNVRSIFFSMLFSSCFACHARQVCVEAFVRGSDETAVEYALALPALVTRNQQHCSPLWIKGKGDAPHSAGRIEPQFLHVGVFRAL